MARHQTNNPRKQEQNHAARVINRNPKEINLDEDLPAIEEDQSVPDLEGSATSIRVMDKNSSKQGTPH